MNKAESQQVVTSVLQPYTVGGVQIKQTFLLRVKHKKGRHEEALPFFVFFFFNRGYTLRCVNQKQDSLLE